MNELTITALTCGGEGGPEAARQRAAGMIRAAATGGADLICLPELFAWTALDSAGKHQAAESLADSPTRRLTAELAAELGVNILSALMERQGARVHNSMFLCDRCGELVGVYRKTFPTDYELSEGISPGPLDFDVFATEFGPLGCAICFDLNFRPVVERIAEQGARLVIFPTMFQGLALMQAWAKLYRMYFLSVPAAPYSALVSPLGVVLAQPWLHDPDLTCTLNLDYEVLHPYHIAARFPEVRARYGPRVRIEHLYNETSALLESRHPQLSAADILREFGMETEIEAEHFRRSAAQRADAL